MQSISNIREYLGDPIQIGLIVRDFESAREAYKNLLGMDTFRVSVFPPETGEDPKRMYRGKEGNFTAKFCFFNWGNIEFEMIEPIEGESVWKDFLSDGKPFGLHHIKFAVDSLEPLDEYFAQFGVYRYQQGAAVGPNKGKTWVFYDTMKLLGFDIEVFNKIIPDQAE